MKYILKYYQWGTEKNKVYTSKEEALLEAYQIARNSNVYINDKQVYTNYKY
jgi:hypothetical protein